ncbi:fimbrial protein, partial [Escherichia coli]
VPIELKDCDTTVTKNATFTFNGTADTTQITAFANQASSDAATNVALQMYMNDGTTAIKPDTETGNILLQDGDQTLTFKVDYIATGKATSGNVNAVTNFHINYY